MKLFRAAPWLWLLFSCGSFAGYAQSSPSQPASSANSKASSSEAENTKPSASALEREFFAVVRGGDVKRFLSFVAEGGVNVGSNAQHLSQTEVENQLTEKRGLYCKLFDSECIQSQIKLDNSNMRDCSYRELLTKSEKVRTAASETTRNGVRQAILVARVKNDHCAGVGLIDFIFNLQADGWKLFSIP